MLQPNWSLVAENYEACMEALAKGYPFSSALQYPGKYADHWNDLADAYDQHEPEYGDD